MLVVTHYSYLAAIPVGGHTHVVERTIEVPVLKQQSIYFLIVLPLMHGPVHFFVALFVHDFIALYIHTPVRIVTYCLESFIGFHGQYLSSFAQAIVPHGI